MMAFEIRDRSLQENKLPSSPCCLAPLFPMSMDGETIDLLCCMMCGTVYDPKKLAEKN